MSLFIVDPKHFPIKTKRIKIDFVKKEHISSIFEIYSNREILKYTDSNTISTIKEAEAIIEKFEKQYAKGKGLFMGLFLKKNEKPDGIISIHDINQKHWFCSCTFILMQKWWNKGIFGEAARAFFECVFINSHINRIEAQVFVENTNAIALMKKLKMQNEGRLRENFVIDGKYEDSFVFSILKKDFNKNAQ